jgi:hypothetical protein
MDHALADGDSAEACPYVSYSGYGQVDGARDLLPATPRVS